MRFSGQNLIVDIFLDAFSELILHQKLAFEFITFLKFHDNNRFCPTPKSRCLLCPVISTRSLIADVLSNAVYRLWRVERIN